MRPQDWPAPLPADTHTGTLPVWSISSGTPRPVKSDYANIITNIQRLHAEGHDNGSEQEAVKGHDQQRYGAARDDAYHVGPQPRRKGLDRAPLDRRRQVDDRIHCKRPEQDRAARIAIG